MISQAAPRLQRSFTPLIVGFLALVVLLLGAAVWFTDSGATITITPKGTTVTTTLVVVLGESTDTDDGTLAATTTTEPLTATVEAKPPAEGALVDAHASGTMTVINNNNAAQPLAVGTRFRSASGIIFRTDRRLDVPAGGKTTVRVVADPLGVEGNVDPGRFVIVALWPGLQDKIYGQTDVVMTGGQIREGSRLDAASLTAASDQAQEKIRQEFGNSSTGVLKLLQPESVTTNPKTDQPSDTYQVTVTMTGRTIKYDQDQLLATMAAALKPQLLEGQTLGPVTLSEIKQTSDPTLSIKVTATAQATIGDQDPAIQPGVFAGKTPAEISAEILKSTRFANVTVQIRPRWQRSVPNQPNRIKVILTTPAP